jgi:Tol biopolymer transport system component
MFAAVTSLLLTCSAIAGGAGPDPNEGMPGLWSEPEPLAEVNLDAAENWGPVLSPDGLTLYFGRVRAPDFYFGRIFQATRRSTLPWSRFTTVVEVPGDLNQRACHALSPWLSPDALRMYYTWQDGAVFRLMVSERSDDDSLWPTGRQIHELNWLDDRLHTCRLTADELTIFFAGPQYTNGPGVYDIWMATRPDPNASFGEPVNVAELNSEWNDVHAAPSPYGLTLYFASNRNGRFQLFLSTRGDPFSLFGQPTPLPEFDAPAKENLFPYPSADGMDFYFVRQSPTNTSERDIWVSYRIE